MEFKAEEMEQPDFREKFAEYRNVQDDFADEVAEEIVKSPHYAEVFRAWSMIQNNNDKVDIQIPKADGSGNGPCKVCLSDEKHQLLVDKLNNYFRDTKMSDYLTQKETLEVIKRGCEFFNVYNANATLALITRSLLKQYAAYNATNVLMFTKMIKDSPNRRILESMRFVRDVMADNGYEPGGRAIRNIQKLRLVHAVIRARINSGKYDRLQFIKEIVVNLTKIADVANDKAAQLNDMKLAEMVKYITGLAKYLNDKVDEINNFNKIRKDKNMPPRNINERAEDLKKSFDYLIEIQNYIAGAAKWLSENTQDYNDLTFTIEGGSSINVSHLINNLERYSRQIEWNEKEWGKPINQQDMIFAVHTFSIEVIDGLIHSGESLGAEEIEAYYLTWHHIGRCLGVKNEINPIKYADGKRLQQIIYTSEFTPYNPNAPALTQPLLLFMKSILPFNNGSQIRAVIANYNDKEDYDIFKHNLQIDLDDIDEVNLFNLKLATSLIGFIVMIRRMIRKSDPKYRYSSFILRHLGIVDQLDGRLNPNQRNNAFGAAFSGTDAEGDLIPETPRERKNFPLIVIKSVWSKAVGEIKGMFSRGKNTGEMEMRKQG